MAKSTKKPVQYVTLVALEPVILYGATYAPGARVVVSEGQGAALVEAKQCRPLDGDVSSARKGSRKKK